MNRKFSLSKPVVPILAAVAILVGATPLLFVACSNGGGGGPTAPDAPVEAGAITAVAQAQNEFVCDGYDDKDNNERAKYTFEAPTGLSIDEICMKRGQNQFTRTCDEGDLSDGCLVLTWSADCTTVMLERVGGGRFCQGMSHAAVNWGDPPPSPSPSPPPSPTPSPSASP